MKTREEVKNEIFDLFLLKKSMECIVNNIRAEIDRKARKIELKVSERVEIILEINRIFQDGE